MTTMNLNRQSMVLGAVAVVLAIPTLLTLHSERELFVDVAAVPHMFEGFTADSVAALAFGSPKPAAAAPSATPDPKKPAVEYDQVSIARTEKGFVLAQLPKESAKLTGAPVSKDLLDSQVFKHLAEIRVDKQTLVQADASDEQLAQYGLDKPKAFVIKVANATGATLAELLVGNDASGGKYNASSVRGTFVCKGDSRDVVLYEQPPTLGPLVRAVKAESWLDKILFRAPPDKVKKFTLKNGATGGATLEFVREQGKAAWTATNPPDGCGAVRQTEIEQMAKWFGTVYVNEFKEPLAGAALKSCGLDPPAIEIGLTWQDGQEEKTALLSVGNKIDGKNENYLRCSTSNFLLTWGSHFVASFEKGPSDLFDPKAVDSTPKDPKKDADDKKPDDKKPDEKKADEKKENKAGG
jgi:hypothetical protein